MSLSSASWTVVNEGNNQVRLHNNNNFLTIMNGNTMVISMVIFFMLYMDEKDKTVDYILITLLFETNC